MARRNVLIAWIRESDVMSDFRQIAAWMTNGANERVTLVGWSEGAGLDVLAAAAAENNRTFNGLVTFGLEDVNVLGWCWKDNITYITRSRPNEPTFQASGYMGKIAPLPYLMIHSSMDEFVSFDEARMLATAAKEPKRAIVIQANNHRFVGLIAVFVPLPKDLLRAAGTLGVGVVIAAAVLFYFIARPQKVARFLPGPLRFASSLLERLSSGLRGMARTREFYLSMAGFLLLPAFQAMAFWLVMLGCGLRLSLWVGAAVFLIVYQGTAIPNAPANIGSYQFFTVVGLTLFGVEKTVATGFSLVVFVLLTLPLLLLGFAAMSASGTSLMKVRREVQTLANH
ncbi:MAG: lysylphosphatidylglycerol synthase domain-containing protein [Blastocatellia bacterium]